MFLYFSILSNTFSITKLRPMVSSVNLIIIWLSNVHGIKINKGKIDFSKIIISLACCTRKIRAQNSFLLDCGSKENATKISCWLCYQHYYVFQTIDLHHRFINLVLIVLLAKWSTLWCGANSKSGSSLDVWLRVFSF